jgi:hypothetical protein
LKDFDETIPPYSSNPFEAHLGLFDLENNLRPGTEPFFEFGRSLAERPEPKEATIHLYLPKSLTAVENGDDPPNETESLAIRMTHCYSHLTELDHSVSVTQMPDRLPLVITSCNLGIQEQRDLTDWVASGGLLLMHGVRWHSWGPSYSRLLGAELSDLVGTPSVQVNLDQTSQPEEVYTFTQFAEGLFVRCEPTTSRVVGRDLSGEPVVFCHEVGKGKIVWTTLSPEDQAGPNPTEESLVHWRSWFGAILSIVLH